MYWFDGVEVAVALVVGLLVGVLEDDELELGAGDGDVAEVGGALHLLGAGSSAATAATGVWSGQTRSHWTIAVAGRCGSSRIVSRSRTNSMSPYPRSHEVIA